MAGGCGDLAGEEVDLRRGPLQTTHFRPVRWSVSECSYVATARKSIISLTSHVPLFRFKRRKNTYHVNTPSRNPYNTPDCYFHATQRYDPNSTHASVPCHKADRLTSLIKHKENDRRTHRQNPTPSMQPITILTNQILQQASILQLHQRHMTRRRNGRQRIDLLLPLPPLRSKGPISIWASEIWNS